MAFTPATEKGQSSVAEGKVDLTGIGLLFADDRIQDQLRYINFLRVCGANVGTYEIVGVDRDHASHIHTAMRGRQLVFLDVNTELAGSSGWDIGERLMQDFVPDEQVGSRYEVVFLTGDPTVSETLERVRQQAGFSALRKTIGHRDLAMIARGKRESQGYFDGIARRVEERYATLIDDVRGVQPTAPGEAEEPGVYSGTTFMRELRAHIYGNATGAVEQAQSVQAIRLIEMGTGNVRYLPETSLTVEIEQEMVKARLSQRVLYWGPKNSEGGTQNIFGILTSLVRSLHVLSGGTATYHFHLMDGSHRYESEPIMPDGIRLMVTATASGSNLTLIEAATQRYQAIVEEGLRGRFEVKTNQAKEQVRYSLLLPNVKIMPTPSAG